MMKMINKTFLSSIKCSFKLINYIRDRNNGDNKMIVKINEGFRSKRSVGEEIILNSLFIFWGPYISCHNLSFFWKIIIGVLKNLTGKDDKKFINQRDIGIIPIII